MNHRDLEEMVAQGQFRRDLLYRLHVVQLHIPPLLQRSERGEAPTRRGDRRCHHA